MNASTTKKPFTSDFWIGLFSPVIANYERTFIATGADPKVTRSPDCPEHLSMKWATHWHPFPTPQRKPPLDG